MGYLIYSVIRNLFNATYFILIVSCFLTWLPNINWYNQPFRFLREFSDFFFLPCRKIVPPISGIDLSPIVAFIVLQIIETVILGLVRMFFHF